MTTTTTFNTVTFEQINKCHRCIDATGKAFYCVENARGDADENGIIEYSVRYDSKSHKFTCSCPSGMEGFAHCHNASGYCWHVRASVEAAKADKKEILAARVAEANDIESDPEYQREYAEYQDEMAQRYDSCVPQA